MWLWIKEYLTDRNQRVCINGCHSSSLPVISGVPQGSILGPILFLVYVNDLPLQVSFSDVFLFADDTKCLKPVSSPLDSSQLQEDLNHLSSWSMNWKLSFNELKCFLLAFQSNHPSRSLPDPSLSAPSYHINGQVVNHCQHHKDLGIIMSSDLSWANHHASIVTQAYKKLGLLRRSFCSSNNISTKKLLYLSLVRSQLVYCSQVWRPILTKDIKLIENVQRRATKFILNDYNTDYKTRLVKLHLLPLAMLYELNDICFFIKSLMQTSSSFNILDYVSFSRNNTRSGTHNKLVLPLSTSSRHKHFFFNRIPRLWNSLPPIDTTRSYCSVATELKNIFWEQFISNFDSSNLCTYHFCCPCTKCQALISPTFT